MLCDLGWLPVSCSYPKKSRPGASHYSLESCFLIAGHRCRLPESGVMGSRVIIIKYTGSTSWTLYGLQTAAFNPPKTIFHSHPLWKTSLPRSANPSQLNCLVIYVKAWSKHLTDVVTLGKGWVIMQTLEFLTYRLPDQSGGFRAFWKEDSECFTVLTALLSQEKKMIMCRLHMTMKILFAKNWNLG